MVKNFAKTNKYDLFFLIGDQSQGSSSMYFEIAKFILTTSLKKTHEISDFAHKNPLLGSGPEGADDLCFHT